MIKKQHPNRCLAWLHVLAVILLWVPQANACNKQESNKSKCVSIEKTMPYVLLAKIEKNKTFVKTDSKKDYQKLHVTEQLASYVDVIYFDLNGDYLTDALVRQKPKNAKDNTAYPLYVYKNTGYDGQPKFEKMATIENTVLPVIVLEKQTKGWRNIVINTNKYSEKFAGALFYYDGKGYVRSPNSFSGAVLK